MGIRNVNLTTTRRTKITTTARVIAVMGEKSTMRVLIKRIRTRKTMKTGAITSLIREKATILNAITAIITTILNAITAIITIILNAITVIVTITDTITAKTAITIARIGITAAKIDITTAINTLKMTIAGVITIGITIITKISTVVTTIVITTGINSTKNLLPIPIKITRSL